MLPQSHAFIALGLQKFLASQFDSLKDADYRKVALASVLPDLIDKPLAVFVFPEMKAGLLFAHAPIFHLPWLILSRWCTSWLPYALAFTGHIIADRIWFFRETFWFPRYGFRFHQWQHIGDLKSFGNAYRAMYKRRPDLFLYEVFALSVFLWFVVSSGLTNRQALWQFIRTGKLLSEQ
jgi:hypothetical protein